MAYMQKRDIKVLRDWGDREFLATNAGWVIPQVLAALGELPLIRGATGLYSFELTLKSWIGVGLWSKEDLRHILGWLTCSPRSGVLGNLVQSKHPQWSAPIPLVLSVFKDRRGVGYSSWDWSDPVRTWFVDPDLLEVVDLGGTPTPPPEEVEDLVTTNSLVKTGRRAGTTRSRESIVNLYGGGPRVKELPRLAKLMVCQCWCYHPSIRTPLMILDWNDLDNIPPPIIDTEVFDKTKQENTLTLEDIWK